MTDYLDDIDLTISTIWSEERITCAHRDVLRAYLEKSLPAGQMDYLRFHLEEIQCPYCRANIQDLRAQLEASRPGPSSRRQAPNVDADAEAEDRLLQSTRAFLRKVSRGPR